ncbi:MAG: dihydropteroate synthase [Planctomycetaceae bacterium]|nr:dihydropteroate synthase [Planctomycetaceae bacterium]
MNNDPEYVLFVTGRLAEPALRRVVDLIVAEHGIRAEIEVLGISVAALMHVGWVTRKLTVPEGVSRVILPGWCQGDLKKLEEKYGVPFQLGPKDLRKLPHFWGSNSENPIDLTPYDIEIIAEINHAPLLSNQELLRIATHYRNEGANLIDYGCLPGESSSTVPEHIKLLKQEGFRISIDSFNRQEVEAAVKEGAELVLSCNSSNLDWACQLDAELVVIPDDFLDLSTMQPAIDVLSQNGKKFRLDPILEPISFGFFKSLQRYAETRERWPEIPVMMGVGNVSELSEVDSAGVNFLLTAICQELQVTSVLTTQVINWARSSVKEIDLSRRMLKYAMDNNQPPKHIDSQLVMLKDAYLYPRSSESLEELASKIKDPNFRIFAEEDGLHMMNRDGHWIESDPFELLKKIPQSSKVDVPHAFYLGYELAMAEIARMLGKQYIQDEGLNWGGLSPEKEPAKDRHDIRKKKLT